MAGRIAVGGEEFIALRNADSYYVDKTELIYDLVHGTTNKTQSHCLPVLTDSARLLR